MKKQRDGKKTKNRPFPHLESQKTQIKMSRGPLLPAALGASAALVALLLAALVVFPLDKDVIVTPLERDRAAKSPALAPIDAEGYKRETVLFPLLGGERELELETDVNAEERLRNALERERQGEKERGRACELQIKKRRRSIDLFLLPPFFS